ncbi:hypothetical protein Gorai_003162 [Gossypium raimondii]|uniref:Uncharacterized protein n=1 Tax=Gossypium raimondii TaxID=29730 RepID=A0A7J8QPE9_GOSRA|nr:hypothetical protein [Gossypium raimondii]
MRHVIKECNDTPADSKELPEDDLPFSLALKAESNLMGKVSMQLGANMKKSMTQCFYLGRSNEKMGENTNSDKVQYKRLMAMKDNSGIREVETNKDSPLSRPNLKEKDKDRIWFDDKFRGGDKDEYKDKVLYSKNPDCNKMEHSEPLIWASSPSAREMGQVDSSYNNIDGPNGSRKGWRRIGKTNLMDQSEGDSLIEKGKGIGRVWKIYKHSPKLTIGEKGQK